MSLSITCSPPMTFFDILSEKGIGCTGTLRENRLGQAPLSEKKEFQKLPRGSTESVTDGKLLITRWNDNRCVTVLTNCVAMGTPQRCSRWSSKEKKHLVLKIPQPLAQYNKNMGGVDLFDQMVACYRIRIRSKKWWWPFFPGRSMP